MSAIVKGFLDNKKTEMYQILLQELFHWYQALGYKMLLKIYFLRSHPDLLPDNLGAVNTEQEEKMSSKCEDNRNYVGTRNYGIRQ